jgi:hypothetical protein
MTTISVTQKRDMEFQSVVNRRVGKAAKASQHLQINSSFRDQEKAG